MQAGLFSAVSSAFVIAVQTNLQPDPNQQSAAVLRLILLTLNQSAIPNESLAVPPVQEDPPPEIVTASGLMYSSLLISLLAAFVAMLGKQWLNRYLRHAGGSMIERCGDRQRKCDGLQEWPFHLFIESLPVMLQVALLLLACGLCQYMASINTPIASVLIALTALGVLFYLAIVVAGTSSYACPFQTPGSTALHGQWKKVRPYTTPLVHLIVTAGAYIFKVLSSNILHPLWKKIVFQIGSSIHRFKRAVMRIALDLDKRVRVTFRSLRYGHPQSPVVSLEEIREDSCMSSEPNSSPHNSSRHNLDPPSREIDSSSQSTRASEPWLVRGALATIQKTNTKDIRCVSWILRNITDPEALDAAIRLAGTILWFEDGTDVDPPYDIIVSTLHTCFDSTGAVYPGLSDRAYYSVRAILWIRICGMCQGEEFARGSFYLPYVSNNRSYNTDLDSILEIYNCTRAHRTFIRNGFTEHNTPEHMQWVSRTFLHSCWAKQKFPYGIFVSIYRWIQNVPWNVIPLGATLDLFLVWTMFLGCPIQEEALKIQDKTYAISRFSLHIT